MLKVKDLLAKQLIWIKVRLLKSNMPADKMIKK
jgi:hypothetical protein